MLKAEEVYLIGKFVESLTQKKRIKKAKQKDNWSFIRSMKMLKTLKLNLLSSHLLLNKKPEKLVSKTQWESFLTTKIQADSMLPY